MLGAVLTMALLSTDTVNPIQIAIDYYQDIAAYQVTVKSHGEGKTEIIHYSFKKPGYVRMEFVAPFKGAVLIYSADTKRAKLWPFGYGSFPSLSLSPGNSLIQSSTGQRVDRSDVGVLYRNVKSLQDHGATEIVGIEALGGRDVLHVVVAANEGFSVGAVSRYQLWLDRTSGFPLKVMSYTAAGKLIEAVEMEDLQLAPAFPAGFFTQ
jgi:outer membrane lipoprotein-sorting protein